MVLMRKTLTQKEVKKRVTKTISEVVSNLFSMSDEAASKELQAGFGEVMQDEGSLFRAGVVYQLNRLIKSGIKGKGKRCTEQELEAVLAQIKSSAPEIAAVIRKELKEVQRHLPRQGGPGREEILSVTEKREACEQIASLHKLARIRTWPEIFEAVAETYRQKGKKISARTIKRVWESRGSLYIG
jgi:hypothetical protein